MPPLADQELHNIEKNSEISEILNLYYSSVFLLNRRNERRDVFFWRFQVLKKRVPYLIWSKKWIQNACFLGPTIFTKESDIVLDTTSYVNVHFRSSNMVQKSCDMVQNISPHTLTWYKSC